MPTAFISTRTWLGGRASAAAAVLIRVSNCETSFRQPLRMQGATFQMEVPLTLHLPRLHSQIVHSMQDSCNIAPAPAVGHCHSAETCNAGLTLDA